MQTINIQPMPHLHNLAASRATQTTVQMNNLSRPENIAQITFNGSTNGTIGSDILATIQIKHPENLTLSDLNTFIGNNYPELHKLNIDGIGTQIILKTPIMGTGNEYRYSNLISTRAGAGFQTAMGGPVSLTGNPEKNIPPQANNLLKDIFFNKIESRISQLLNDSRTPTDADAKAAVNELLMDVKNSGELDSYFAIHTAKYENSQNSQENWQMNYLTATVIVSVPPAKMDKITNSINNGGRMFKIVDSDNLIHNAASTHQTLDSNKTGPAIVFNDLAVATLQKQSGSVLNFIANVN